MKTITRGWYELGPEDVIKQGDRYYLPKCWENMEGINWASCFDEHFGMTVQKFSNRYDTGHAHIIRKSATQPKGFEVGSKVNVEYNNFNQKGVIKSKTPEKTDCYTVEFNDFHYSEIDFIKAEASFGACYIKPEIPEVEPIKVGTYEAVEKENGVQVGCTFVSDETIRAIAKLRKIV